MPLGPFGSNVATAEASRRSAPSSTPALPGSEDFSQTSFARNRPRERAGSSGSEMILFNKQSIGQIAVNILLIGMESAGRILGICSNTNRVDSWAIGTMTNMIKLVPLWL